MKKCLIIGAIIADTVMNIDHVPVAGEDISASCLSICAGGCAYNVACILQEFNIPNTLLAPIGSGMYGEFIEKCVKERGIETICSSEEYDNGYTLCLIDKKAERTFINIGGAETHFRSEWLEKLNMDEYDTIYIAGYEMEGDNYDILFPFLEEHKNKKIYFSPGPSSFRIQKPYIQQILDLGPILHLNAIEAMYISGEKSYSKAADALFVQTGAPVIITTGKEGCLVKTQNETRFIEAIPAEAIDTNGAGDAHVGTVISMRKKNYSFFDAARIGNYISSLVIQQNAPNLPKNQLKGFVS